MSQVPPTSRVARAYPRARRAATQRTQATDAATRRAKTERLQFTLDSIGDGLITVDTRQRITFINRAAQQLTGWQSSEALGKKLTRVFHLINAQTRQTIANPVRIALKKRTIVGLPANTLLVAKGAEYFISCSIAPIHYRAGEISGAVLVFRDITRLRQAENALKEAQQFTASLIANSLDMIIAVDHQRRIIEFNPAAERTFGYTRDEILGQDVSILYANADESNKVNQATRVAGSITLEAWNRRKNGQIFPALLSVSQLKNAAGEVIGTMGVSREITELKRMEEQRIRSQQLTALGRMASALAHEINNPLQAIRSTLDLTLDFSLPEHEYKENLEIIRQEIERLSQITERILRFARPTLATHRRVCLGDLIRQTLALADKYLQQQHIHVTYNFSEIPLLFLAPEQMIQVFLNLILNAIDAAGKGGKLDITTRIENEQVLIAFTNDGPILSSEEQAHLFQPFFTSKVEGTGLGLYVAQTIVQQHNGNISAENIGTERGVRFTIHLPLTMTGSQESV